MASRVGSGMNDHHLAMLHFLSPVMFIRNQLHELSTSATRVRVLACSDLRCSMNSWPSLVVLAKTSSAIGVLETSTDRCISRVGHVLYGIVTSYGASILESRSRSLTTCLMSCQLLEARIQVLTQSDLDVRRELGHPMLARLSSAI